MDNSNNSKLTNIIFYITISIFIFFTVLFSFLSIIQSSYMGYTIYDHNMVYRNFFTIQSFILFIILAVFGILISKFGDKISSKKVLIIEMIVFAIIGFIYCLSYSGIYPQHDSKNAYEAALALSKGDASLLAGTSSMGTAPNNLGLLSEYYLFLKLFGDNINNFTYMRLINLVISIIGYVYLYKITDILYKNNKVNLYLLLLFLGFNHLLLFSSFIYSNVMGYSFAIASIYYLIYYLKIGKRLWLSFIFMILSIFIRKNSLIVLIAEIIVLLIDAFNKKKLLNYALVLFFSIALLTSQVTTKLYEIKYDVKYVHQLPAFTWVYYGFNYYDGTPGGYVQDFIELFREYDHNPEVIHSYGKAYVESTMNYFKDKPLEYIEFNIKKFISAWCDQDYDLFSNNYNLSCTIWDYEPIMNDVYDAFLSLMAIGLLVFAYIRRKQMSYDFILILSVVGGFLFHLFWEIKAIYTYQYVLLLLPLSAYGLDKAFNKLNKKLYGSNR